MTSDPDHATAAATIAIPEPAAVAAAAETAPAGGAMGPAAPSAIDRLVRLLKREPVLVVSLVYALVSAMGMWSHYWFYRRLDFPILEYLQGADLFVIGLRRPDYFLVVLAVLAFVRVSLVPVRWAARNPERARALAARHPWIRWVFLFPDDRKRWLVSGLSFETQLVLFGLVLSLQYLLVWSVLNANRVVEGRSDLPQVRLTLAGADAPVPGQARLLGTTSAYVLVWWPGPKQVEVFPVANLARIEQVRVPEGGQPAHDAELPADAAPGAEAADAGAAAPAAADAIQPAREGGPSR